MDRKEFVKKIDKIKEKLKPLKEKAKKQQENKLLDDTNKNLKEISKKVRRLEKKKVIALEEIEETKKMILETEKSFFNYENLSNRILKAKNYLKINLSNLKNLVFIVIMIFTLGTFYLIFKFIRPLAELILNIFSKGIGSYEFSQIFILGLGVFSLGFLVCEILVIANIFEKKRFPWVAVTLILMICFFFVAIFYTHIAIGQEDLSLFLRNNTNSEIVGNISCEGSSLVLMVEDVIKCRISPKMNLVKGKVSFKYYNKTNSPQINLTNDSFIAQKDVEYIRFDIEGVDEKNIVYQANVGSPYHFYTVEEYNKMRKDFVKYLGIIFTIIFVSIPIIMNRFKELYK